LFYEISTTAPEKPLFLQENISQCENIPEAPEMKEGIISRFFMVFRRLLPERPSFVLLLSALFLSSCATTLPDVSLLMKEVSQVNNTPEIQGHRGDLTPRKTNRILNKVESRGNTDLVQANVVLMESLSGQKLTAGNRATLLVDGPATYAAMSTAIEAARDHINIETYIFDDDEVGRRFADQFLRKQAAGVQVNLIYDSIGCKNTPAAFFKRLREGGVNVLEFNPINPLKANPEDFFTHRDHRKVLVVDGKTAFTGGVNISSVYSGSPPFQEPTDPGMAFGWRDTHVMIEGPVVAQFQKLFLETWRAQKGPPLAPLEYFPPLQPLGKDLIMVIGSTPGDTHRLTYIMYVAALTKASHSVHMTNAYFVPDEQTMQALTGAAERGVDVELILPGLSDSNLALYAGRSHYEDLLEAGVKLYERRDRMLHAKTAVIDGVWSTIGSTNLDLWSFLRNNEINAIIIGINFSNQMEVLFQKDIEESNRISQENWSRRPLWGRIKEWIGRLFSHWL
jgi:cardiolipin synthase A/B